MIRNPARNHFVAILFAFLSSVLPPSSPLDGGTPYLGKFLGRFGVPPEVHTVTHGPILEALGRHVGLLGALVDLLGRSLATPSDFPWVP